MKGLSGGRPAQLQLTSPTSAYSCGLVECNPSLDHHLHHGNVRSPSYLLSPTESCPLDSHRRCSPRSSIHSECMVMPVPMSTTDHSISSSTFPRMHYGSASRDSGGNTSGGRETREDGGSSTHGGSSKMNRIPANLLDQFEKQMPLHRDGFHTLQYQRTSTTTASTEQRNESPGRIRHLVHSVQKLFTKSHSLEGSSKINGTKSESHRDSSHHHHHHHQGHHKHSKRSKSKDRKSDGGGKQRSGGWWSSDDNLDSDSTYRPPSVMSRHPVEHISHCYSDSVHGHLVGDMSLKTSKSNNDVKCTACESINMAPEGKFMKRSSWSTLTVSQAKEAYRKSSLNLEKPMTPTDLKPNLRPCHYLQELLGVAVDLEFVVRKPVDCPTWDSCVPAEVDVICDPVHCVGHSTAYILYIITWSNSPLQSVHQQSFRCPKCVVEHSFLTQLPALPQPFSQILTPFLACLPSPLRLAPLEPSDFLAGERSHNPRLVFTEGPPDTANELPAKRGTTAVLASLRNRTASPPTHSHFRVPRFHFVETSVQVLRNVRQRGRQSDPQRIPVIPDYTVDKGSKSEVPQDDWGGYPGDGKDDEIPCRRMRSSSYVKAMGDEESGESDSSPKASPQKSVRPEALVKAVIRPRDLLDSQSSYRLDKINSDMRNYITNFAADLSQSYHLQTTRNMHPSIALEPSTNYNSPKFRSRNQSYMRAVSTLSQASCVSQVSQVSETEINGQFESVCESVFSEVESQAMEALDLPGCFRTRSHSYLRAIQAGYSQDDDCIPPMASTVTSTIRSTTDRNYAQQDSCLPDEASVHEDLADTAPLAHDDLGCPIRRDRLYQESIGAAAKSLSGPPVSPSLFRSTRASASERPSPKAIQASIKESATLAAAISMQWKEEVSAMRRELADLRRDLCKELRAFNSNFNTFTQHYNTWSPQAGNMSAGADGSFDRGMGTGSRPGPGKGGGVGFGTSPPKRGTGGAREKKPQVSTVSVGTQARSKVLVRQSTADAAVNCPEDKDDKKSTRRNLPKQLSMDPSILACPQLMYVESAIPLSLDPILPCLVKTLQPTDMATEPCGDKAEPEIPNSKTASLPEDYVEPVVTESPGSSERSACQQAFLWYRWQKRGQRRTSLNRSASVELWSRRYEYNSAEITYVSLTLLLKQQVVAITYTPNYKKTPPPVPPRTTSKPLISITAQSSTESTQDAYHEGRHPHSGMWNPESLGLGLGPGRGLYNSTDSLDSTKAVTIAMEAAGVMAGKRHPSTDSHSSVLTCDKAVLVSKAEEYLKTPRSSIGIQVEAATDSESESKGSREYQSVGIQVEDNKKGQGRFKRSNSVTAAVQADMELEGFPVMEDKGLQFGGGFQRHSEPSTPTQYGAVRTVRTQGLFSYRDDYRTLAEPPSPRETSREATWQLEPPSPRENTASSAESGRASPSLRRDGSWFMQLLHTDTKRIEGWCKEMEAEAEENDLSEEILGKIRSAVGSAQLLMSQKFQQFYWLCQQNLDPSAMPRPTSQDLAGFWDLLQLSIDDVTVKFDQLQQIKNNNWRLIDSPEKKPPAPVPKKPARQKSVITREKSLDLPDRHRQEARRRLMAAKRAASFRQNSGSERADSIEIYIPEAQTRL
ncbi:Disks large-associated protein 2 [Takifugu flavidus]|uniref:Disks large-associated protein 2 n=1 Tax=Takifugu flavidus TaxID=433684 RepID=A0A5C6P005_9TELE|nr:Disks large-associated protein 2 [Takifugu flavidus]